MSLSMLFNAQWTATSNVRQLQLLICYYGKGEAVKPGHCQVLHSVKAEPKDLKEHLASDSLRPFLLTTNSNISPPAQRIIRGLATHEERQHSQLKLRSKVHLSRPCDSHPYFWELSVSVSTLTMVNTAWHMQGWQSKRFAVVWYQWLWLLRMVELDLPIFIIPRDISPLCCSSRQLPATNSIAIARYLGVKNTCENAWGSDMENISTCWNPSKRSRHIEVYCRNMLAIINIAVITPVLHW